MGRGNQHDCQSRMEPNFSRARHGEIQFTSDRVHIIPYFAVLSTDRLTPPRDSMAVLKSYVSKSKSQAKRLSRTLQIYNQPVCELLFHAVTLELQFALLAFSLNHDRYVHRVLVHAGEGQTGKLGYSITNSDQGELNILILFLPAN